MLALTAADVIDDFNLAEAVFWLAFAPLAAFGVRRWSPWSERLMLAAIVVLFGISDLVEVQTGAWWRPWWLAAWKFGAACAGTWIGWRIWRRAVRPHE